MANSSAQIQNICCIGAGYVGGPTMAVIADKCPHLTVNVVDLNQERISAWNSKNLRTLPIYEPGLDQVIERARGRNLFFSTDVKSGIKSADMIFISVNTPTKTKGLGSGQASDLRWVEACAREVAEHAEGHTIVVEKSTLPVKTAAAVQAILHSSNLPNKDSDKSKSFVVLSNPEFLAEGTAIADLECPDRVLIGGEDQEAIKALSNIYSQWVPQEKILHTNLWSSELSKLTANAFLAQRISSINSVAALCEVTGADVREVAKAIGTDSRIGEKFLSSGPGFGGSCFKKDILNLVYLCRHFGLPEVADYWQNVVTINNWQQTRIARLVVNKLFGTVTSKKLALLGFAFKANTNDTREAPAISIAKDLLEEGAELAIYDPKVDANQIALDLGVTETKANIGQKRNKESSLNNEGTWWAAKSLYDASKGADAILIITEWEEFRSIDWNQIGLIMRQPAWVFDSRGVVIKDKVKSAGLKLWIVGEGFND